MIPVFCQFERKRLFLVTFLLLFTISLMFWWDKGAVLVARMLKGPGVPAETGCRVRYLSALRYCGQAGKSEARHFAQQWWNNTPTPYAIYTIKEADYAYVGLPKSMIFQYLGAPSGIANQEIRYVSKMKDSNDCDRVLIFHVSEERVQSVEIKRMFPQPAGGASVGPQIKH